MAQEIIATILSNTQGNWMSRRGNCLTDVSGKLLNVSRTKAGLKLETDGGPAYWPMDAAVADAVIDGLVQHAANMVCEAMAA